MKIKTIMISLAIISTAQSAPPEKFWAALHIVETGGALGPIRGDNGAALGPLQIHRSYWADSKIEGRYEDCQNLAYSRRVVSAYLQRYAPRAWQSADCASLAKIHNGGPNALRSKGQKLVNVNRYASRVISHLK